MLALSANVSAMPIICTDSINYKSEGKLVQNKDTVRAGQLPKEYQNLKHKSSKNKWTRRLFSLLIREERPPKKEGEKPLVDEYEAFREKVIRSINIKVLSPFGTDINNPEKETEDLKVLNNLHVSTRRSTIRSLLQFKKGDLVSPSLIAASEAEIRSANYINDARIVIVPIDQENDSVDVNIVVRDRWTIGAELHGLSSSKVDVELFDKNILGTGSRVGLNFIYLTGYEDKLGYGGNYAYDNIARTNINLEGSYLDDIRTTEVSGALIRKLQPKLKHFGEISYRRKIIRPETIQWDSITPDYNEQFSATLGRAFTLSDTYSIRRLVLSFRYKIKSPKFRPLQYQDYIKDIQLPYKHTKNQIWLMQLSLYENSYQREYMVYNFGTTEDIAQGYNISMQLGYSKFNHINDALYSSLCLSYGSSNLVIGNIYGSSAISSFFDKGKPFESILKFEMRYFTPLRKLGKFNFRQFMTINYSKMLTPDVYFGDRIYMGQHTSMRMRNWRYDHKGTEFFMIKTENDMFSNYQIAGFRLLFYNFLDLGWITPRGNLLSNDNFNYGLGFGIRLRNNFIILNTIDLKIGFYPKLTQSGFNSFFQFRSSTPDVPPNFVPYLPNEIVLE